MDCFLHSILRGTHRQHLARPRNVLIVFLGKLGDMVCSTPIFRAIKQAHPNCRVTVMGNVANQKLLECNTDVDEYIPFTDAESRTVHFLRQHGFDAALLPSPNFVLLAMLLRARIPCVVTPVVVNGKSTYSGIGYRVLQTLTFTVPHRMGSYAPAEFLNLLAPLGIRSTDTEKHLGFTHSAQDTVRSMLRNCKGKTLVGIAPGTGNWIKLWGEKKFAELANYVAKRYRACIVIVGAKNDIPCAERMISFLHADTPYCDTTGRLSLDELKALMPELRMFISVDSGPIYIAEAFHTPTIDIVGPMDENEMPPRGKNHLVVVPPNRSAPATHIMSARPKNTAEARQQVESITVALVCRAVDKLFNQ